MSKLEQLTPNAAVHGILPDGLVTVVSVQWFGSEALELTYKSPNGKVANVQKPDGPKPDSEPSRRQQEPPKHGPRRFHGSVTLDPTRVGRDAGRIADEIVSHLTGLMGSTVKVTLEIGAEIPSGAPDQVVRTVTENCRTLKFASQGFETE
jgi:hypothetical protein